MAEWTGDFELRRFLIKLSRGPAGGYGEDAAWMGFRFLKLTDGEPDADWLTADYAAVEARADTLWTTLKTYYASWVVLDEYRWYKSGPAWEPEGDQPNNPAVRVTDKNVVGTSSGTNGMLPPQVALALTLKTAVRKRWGRVYLPAILVSGAQTICDANGRLNATPLANLPALFVTMLNGIRADGYKPVVWSKARSAYTTPGGTLIPDHEATAYEILSVQMDNVFDVVRSRRWSSATARTQTTLT